MAAPHVSPKRAHPLLARSFLVLFLLFLLFFLAYEATEYLLSFSRPQVIVMADRAPDVSPAPASADGKKNLNALSWEDLSALPGIGPAFAQAIVDYREKIGGFAFLDEVKDVPGIGEKRLSLLRQYVYCPPP